MNPITDRDRIRTAFKSLRALGFECHMNWQCCQGCGCAALRDSTTRYAFYHRQDASGFDGAGNVRKDDCVHVAFGSGAADGRIIVDALTAAGLRVVWNGTESARPAIVGAL